MLVVIMKINKENKVFCLIFDQNFVAIGFLKPSFVLTATVIAFNQIKVVQKRQIYP
jgi:hypothetical protein